MGRATAVKHTAQIRAPSGEGTLLPGQRDCDSPCGGASHKVRQHCWSCRLAPCSLRDDSISLLISITSFAGSRQGEEGSQHAYGEFSASPAALRSKEVIQEFPALATGQGCLGSATILHKSHPCSHHPPPWCTHIRTFLVYFGLSCSWE